jgi:hypothetical protein
LPRIHERSRPTTRGTNFYLADTNLEFVCATVMTLDVKGAAATAGAGLGSHPAEALAAATAGPC